MEFYEWIGSVIKRKRKEKGMTIKELSDKTSKIEKISSSTVSEIETGKSMLKIDKFLSLCVALEINPETIIGELIKEKCKMYYNSESRKIKKIDYSFDLNNSFRRECGSYLKYARKIKNIKNINDLKTRYKKIISVFNLGNEFDIPGNSSFHKYESGELNIPLNVMLILLLTYELDSNEILENYIRKYNSGIPGSNEK